LKFDFKKDIISKYAQYVKSTSLKLFNFIRKEEALCEKKIVNGTIAPLTISIENAAPIKPILGSKIVFDIIVKMAPAPAIIGNLAVL
jgi:hypothetical protein